MPWLSNLCLLTPFTAVWMYEVNTPAPCSVEAQVSCSEKKQLCLIICIVRTSSAGDSYHVFCSGFPESFSHGTLPDYLHRPYIFRRGQLSSFFFWVPWRVFHTVLCLIIYIVRTSLGGESYRVFFFVGSLEGFSHGTLPDLWTVGDFFCGFP